MRSFAHRILTYQRKHGRHDLPWQHPRTPYRVWVSEIMLQQTQVSAVIPYFRTFIRDFPNVKRLAQAPLDEVLARWSGLGYYARARNLHQAARMIRQSGGRLPRSVDDWMRLPGVGRSTAGAIVALAFDEPAPMLDGNARRVIARHQGLSPTAGAALWATAQRLLPKQHAAVYTQGLMDLGAQVCAPRAPRCEHCPLRIDCHHFARKPAEQTVRKSRALPQRTAWVAIVQTESGQVLLRQRESRGIWGGLWSLPEHPSLRAARQWAEQRGAPCAWRREPPLVHRLSHLELRLCPLRARIPDSQRAAFAKDGRWFDPQRLTVGVAAPIQKLIAQL